MKGRTLRLFVAIYPPTESRIAMAEVLGATPALDPRHRATAPDQIHMTIQFIGETHERDLDDTIESVTRSAAGIGPFQLSPLRLITLPERGHPRLIALETDAPPALLELQRRLGSRLARNPRARPGDRFLPHLTLCRFNADIRAARLDHTVQLGAFDVRRVHLMKSILRPQGAAHSQVAEVPL